MSREIIVHRYLHVKDRGASVSRNPVHGSYIDADELVAGSALPHCEEYFGDTSPIVEYFDGEALELRRNGESHHIRHCDGEVLVASFSLGGTGGVSNEEEIYVEVAEVSATEKPDFPTMMKKGSLSALVMSALPILKTNPEAELYLRRTVIHYEFIYLLAKEAVDEILVAAQAQDAPPVVLLAKGCCHLYRCLEANSTEIAYECFRKAASMGDADAKAYLAHVLRKGYAGYRDLSSGNKLMQEAVSENSEYAAQRILSDMIYGTMGMDKNPDLALSHIDSLMKVEPDNPLWLYLKGNALFEKFMAEGKSVPSGAAELLEAAEMGYIPAWIDWALAAHYVPEKEEFDDLEAFKSDLKKGLARRNYSCAYTLAAYDANDYDEQPLYNRGFWKERVTGGMKRAYEYGSADAALYLGNMYAGGWLDTEIDYNEAWSWYAKAALMFSGDAYHHMYLMVKDGTIEEPQAFLEYLAVTGARLGSDELGIETVRIYRKGGLTAYAAEIERDFLPKYSTDADERDDEEAHSAGADDDDTLKLPDDELPDDDGRFDAYV